MNTLASGSFAWFKTAFSAGDGPDIEQQHKRHEREQKEHAGVGKAGTMTRSLAGLPRRPS